jgi:3-hydroxypropanoate dehydrogenase
MNSYSSPEHRQGAALDDDALDQVFRSARTFKHWLPRAITDAEMRRIHDLARMPPTSANSNPARFVWVTSASARAKLAECVNESNRTKILAAPTVVIVGNETQFHLQLEKLMGPAGEKYRAHFEANEAARNETSLSSSTLQGAYLILAARALGFDCGPIGGFNRAAVNDTFFSGTTISANFLCCVGHGDPASLSSRLGRFEFDDVNSVI